jgi:alpha-L-arabinofuranosidase
MDVPCHVRLGASLSQLPPDLQKDRRDLHVVVVNMSAANIGHGQCEVAVRLGSAPKMTLNIDFSKATKILSHQVLRGQDMSAENSFRSSHEIKQN